MQVKGSRILVTGASSGIGAALAVRAARAGATVGLVARREDRLARVLATCQESSPDSRMWVADLGDVALAERVALEAWQAFGHLDVLVNNAGVPMRRHTASLDYETLEWVMRVNFLAPARMMIALLPAMRERGQGMIVNVSSVAGRIGNANESAYSASKFALCGWSEGLAIDLDGSGVEVRLIEPGPIDTDIWDRPGEDAAVFVPDLQPPSLVADGIIAAIEGEQFEHYLPDLKSVVTWKESDIDAYIHMSADLRRKAEDAAAPPS
jgi:short-subunit dehydrogenase